MAFAEVRIDAGMIIYATKGGPEYSTDVVVTKAGDEYRNRNWVTALGKWEYGDRKLSGTDLATLLTFFRARGGRYEGFRLKDWADFQATNAPLNTTGYGNGMPVQQLYKNYTSGIDTDQRIINKPVSGTVIVERAGSVVAVGSSPGDISIDTTTGLVTFVADASSAATINSLGSVTIVSLTSNPGLSVGQLLYLSGFSGAGSSALNGVANLISAISGTGPYLFTLSTNTNGLTITGTGLGAKYAQISESLTWSGEFDVAVRFDTDRFQSRFDSADIQIGAQVGETFHYLESLPIVGVRE